MAFKLYATNEFDATNKQVLFQVSDTKKTGGTYNLFGKQKPKIASDKPEESVEKTVNKENKNNEAVKEEKGVIPSKTVKKVSCAILYANTHCYAKIYLKNNYYN